MSEARIAKSFCRICQGYCAVEITVADGKIVQVRGDETDPVTRGYICFKGAQAAEQYHGTGRLKSSLRRGVAGFEPVAAETALSEIAAKISDIVARHGPHAVAFFNGTQGLFSALNRPLIYAFAAALGTPRMFGTMTIDQSAKWITEGRLGSFSAGYLPFESADVWLLIGCNPLVTMMGGNGFSGFASNNPLKSLKEAKARGMKLIVIDPRRTETARYADIFVQPRPGEDATLVAGLLHLVLANGWHDAEFCARHVDNLAELRTALTAFTPERVAARTDVPPELLLRTARVFALESKAGMAGSGTGPSMAPHSNLTEHLIQTLNAVCGRYPRAGDRVVNPGVLSPPRVRYAEPVAPVRTWESGPKTTVHGLGTLRGQMMSAVLADEILQEDAGRIRALICTGANPAAALPDEIKAVKALASLELLVTIDPRMSSTAKLAHYVIAPKMPYERADHTGPMEYMFPVPYAQYSPAIIDPQPDMDLVDDWYVFWRLAKHLGLQLKAGAVAIPMDRVPATGELLELLSAGSRVPLSRVKQGVGGHVYDEDPQFAQPARPDSPRFQLAPADVLQELDSLIRELQTPGTEVHSGYPLRLIVRRDRDVMNSALTDFDSLHRRKPFGAAYLNPDEAAAHGLAPGDRINICSPHARIAATVAIDADLRMGVVSMPHCWNGIMDATHPDAAPTSRLVDSEWNPQSINRMPILTAIPVRLERPSAKVQSGAVPMNVPH